MLQSRTVADNLIREFDLQKLLDKHADGHAQRVLAARSSFRISREGIIGIEIEDKDPKRAAAYRTPMSPSSTGSSSGSRERGGQRVTAITASSSRS